MTTGYRLNDFLPDHLAGVAYVNTDLTAIAAGGTGTARTSIAATYRVPNWARELLAVCPVWTSDAPSVAESALAVMDISGQNYDSQPLEVWFPVGGAHLDVINEVRTTATIWWPVHKRVIGGEIWDIGIEPLDAQAGNTRAYVALLYSSIPTGIPLVRSKSTRETSTGTTAGAVAGETLTLNNVRAIFEVGAIATPSTVTADVETWGTYRLNSTALTPQTIIDFPIEPASAIEATSGVTDIASILRVPIWLRAKENPVTVTSQFTLDKTLTTAGQFAHYIRYI